MYVYDVHKMFPQSRRSVYIGNGKKRVLVYRANEMLLRLIKIRYLPRYNRQSSESHMFVCKRVEESTELHRTRRTDNARARDTTTRRNEVNNIVTRTTVNVDGHTLPVVSPHPSVQPDVLSLFAVLAATRYRIYYTRQPVARLLLSTAAATTTTTTVSPLISPTAIAIDHEK